MSKRTGSIGATIGMTAGGSVPFLFGDTALLDGWGLLGGLIGGILGVWAAVWFSKRYG